MATGAAKGSLARAKADGPLGPDPGPGPGPGPGSGPGGPCALLPESGKGSSPAPVPPVAMYFHKKGIEITYNK